MAAGQLQNDGPAGMTSAGEEYLTRVVLLPARQDEAVVAVLQQPLEGALASFHRLQRELALFSLASLAVALVASVVMARGIARPVQQLAQVARRIASGDYTARAARRRAPTSSATSPTRSARCRRASRRARRRSWTWRIAIR